MSKGFKHRFTFPKIQSFKIIILTLWLLVPVAQGATSTDKSSPERDQLLRYLHTISGKMTIVGIENKNMSRPTSDTEKITAIAGKSPGLWGADFGFGPNAIAHRQQLVQEAIHQWQKGAIVNLMYHACPPTMNEDCDWDDIGGKHPVHLTDAQWTELLTPGTTLNNAWLNRLDKISVYLEELKKAHVAVLFRPFHEMNQCVFWWSCHKGPDGSAALYRMTRNYLSDSKKLNNIVWVWSLQDFPSLASDIKSYDPGRKNFDVATLDIYEKSGFSRNKYHLMLQTAKRKPIAIGECELYPTVQILEEQPRWAYVMLWPDFLKENLQLAPRLFQSGRAVTLNRMRPRQ